MTNSNKEHGDILYHLSKERNLPKAYRANLAKQLRKYLRDTDYHKKGRTDHNLFTFLADAIPNGIVITDANRQIEWINRAYTEMTGYTLEEAVGKKPGDLLQGPHLDEDKKRDMAEKLAREVAFKDELLNYKKNGDPFWIQITIAPIFDEDDNLQNFIGIQEDITDRKKAELSAMRNIEILEVISSQAQIAVYLKDEEGRYMYVNSAWKKMTSVEDECVVGKTVKELMDEPTASVLHEQDKEVLVKDKTIQQEKELQNGTDRRFYRICKFPVSNIRGIKKGIGGVALDITELKLAQEKEKRNETRLKLSQKIAEIGYWELNLAEDKLIWSDEIYRILEMNPDQLDPSYEAFMDLVHPEDKNKVEQAFKESLKNKNIFRITHRLQFHDGRIKYVEEHAEHFYDEEGTVFRTIGTVQDITKRQRNQQKLREALEEKESLLAEIHHRVKNNLAVVSGLLQLQWFEEEDPDITDKLQDSFNRIKTIAGIHEQLYQTEQFANVDLGENLERLASDLISTMETDTEIDLECDCQLIELSMEQTLPCSLIANEVITNAIKHAFNGRKNGKITICLKESGDHVVLEISDNGIGLPENFEKQKGSLGVQLIDTLARQLEADFSFKSLDEGTTFIMKCDPVNDDELND